MPVPRFWQIIEERYRAGLSHQFILYFNINDLIWDDIYGYLYMRDYLMERMNYLGCDAVIYYNRTEGVQFPNIELRRAYQEVFKLSRIEEIEPMPVDENGNPVPVKNINEGLKNVGSEGKLVREPQEALMMIERFLRQTMGNLKVGVLINDVEKIVPNRKGQFVPESKMIEVETLQRWAVDLQIKFRGHIILLLTENLSNVATELLLSEGQSTYPVMIPVPTYQERLHYIRHLLYIPEAEGEEGKYKLDLPEGMLSEEFSNITHGLTLTDIQNLWITSKARKTHVSPAMIIEQNRDSIRKRSYGKLELIFGDYGLNGIGGLGHILQYFSRIINSMKNWDIKAVPMGVLMVGPPGTGKTSLINALSRDMGIHFVRLKGLTSTDPLAKTQWDIHRAFDVIRSLIPVVVFIDNIDQFIPSKMDELTEQLLMDLVNFMGDTSLKGRVLWVAATNRPDLIHPEFRKRGRLDDVVPFFLPDAAAREEILRRLITRNAIPYDANLNFRLVASRAERCSGGDLELILMRAFQTARYNDRDIIIEQDLIKSIDEFVHPYSPAVDEYFMLLAAREANIASLVPRVIYGNLHERIYENNRINKFKIEQRLRELEGLVSQTLIKQSQQQK